MEDWVLSPRKYGHWTVDLPRDVERPAFPLGLGTPGELPWALSTIHAAEAAGPDTPEWLAELGTTYLQMGQAAEALRLFADLSARCEQVVCQGHLLAKVSVFRRAAVLLQQRGINSRTHPEAANRVLRELLKPAQIEQAASSD